MVRYTYYWLSLYLIGFLAACSPIRVAHTESDPGFQLSSYKTFDFLDVTAKSDSTQVPIPAEYVTVLKKEVSQQLERRGLRQTTGTPDLLINLGLVVIEKTQTRQTDFVTDAPRYIGQRRYTWKSKEVEVGTYKQGTVSVHLVDRAQDQLVWSAEAASVIPNKAEKLEERISKGVERLFRSLPTTGMEK